MAWKKNKQNTSNDRFGEQNKKNLLHTTDDTTGVEVAHACWRHPMYTHII